MMISENRRLVVTVLSILVLPLVVTVFAFVSLIAAEPGELSVGSQLVASPAPTAYSASPAPDTDFLYQDGVNAYEMGRYQLAEARFREAVSLLPESAILYNRLGMALGQQDRSLEAILAYQKAIALDPTLVEAHYNLGAIFQLAQRKDEAEQAYRAALNIDETFALAYIGLGELYLAQQDVQASIQAFEQATAYAPDQVIAWRGLGAGFAKSGEWERSVNALETAVTLQPENALAHYDLGVVYSFLDMDAKARREFTLVQSITDDASLKFASTERLNELLES